MENYNLGKLIKKIRIKKNIMQDKLCYGLCSVTTLCRIENSKKNVEIVLAKALFERMGIYSEKFMYILDEEDFILYEKEVCIKKYIKENKFNAAIKELKKYEKKIINYKNIRYQFVYKSYALIENSKGNTEEAKSLVKKAMNCTIPEFEKINLKEYYMSSKEIDIFLEYIKINNFADEAVDFKNVLTGIFKIMNRVSTRALSQNRLYPKVCYMYANFLMDDKNYELCQKIANSGLEVLALTGDLNYRSNLIFLNTISLKNLNPSKNYLNEFLDAYYIAKFCGQDKLAVQIENIMKESYNWESIEEVPS